MSTRKRIVRYDTIGHWSEIKLDIIKEYAKAYTTIVRAQQFTKRCIYIDAFAGAGKHISRRTGEFVPGSPLNALEVKPGFTEHHFIDLERARVEELRRVCKDRNDIQFYEGDCNDVLLQKIFPRCRFEDYARALCILDPYKLGAGWEALAKAGSMRTIEIFYSFMIMDANRNVLWRKPADVTEKQRERMDFIWGDRSWTDAVYQSSPGLFGEMVEKTTNEMIVKAFENRLRDVAGFGYVAESLPMKNDQGAVVYYLMFASPKATGARIVSDIFKRDRTGGTR